MQTTPLSLARKTTYGILLFFCLFTVSCAIGPDSERKSKLNYLSGEHYESTVNMGGVVPIVVQSKKVNTTIAGTVLLNEYNPLKFTTLLLQNNNKTILETRTDNKGLFKFNGYLENGEYVIKTYMEKYALEKTIKVDKYKIEGLLFKIESN